MVSKRIPLGLIVLIVHLVQNKFGKKETPAVGTAGVSLPGQDYRFYPRFFETDEQALLRNHIGFLY